MATDTVQRNFLPANPVVSDWEQIATYFKRLLESDIDEVGRLKNWLLQRSELESWLQEEMGWRYIRMSCDTANEEYAAAFNFFVGEIQPRIAPLSQELDIKLLNSKALDTLTEGKYRILLRQIRKRVEIYREENVPILSALQQKEQEYSSITGAMTVEVEGKELTLQQAANYLEQDNRAKREEVYLAIARRRLTDKEKLDTLFDELAQQRHVVAQNAGFADFRDYMFASLGRFDYSAEDCYRFHEAVEKYVVPINEAIEEKHRSELQLEVLKPWDLHASAQGESPLKPFSSAAELMEKTIACFQAIDPFLGDCMRQMKSAGRLDLESRKGKAPGGYNYPLYETGLPFIFMNSTNTLRDLVTMVHEGGHAVQSIVDKPLELVDFKNLPSEVAELASMSMELISMEHWEHFFSDADELKKARRKHLEDVLKGLPWIACVDAFQHWMYTHPGHSVNDRCSFWTDNYMRYAGKVVDWGGQEEFRSYLWQKQLHIYEVPFYYIEYGFAQLGAIAVWKNYRENPSQTISHYLNALKMGYTASIGEIYEAAGIRFDFSDEYVKELSAFVLREWKLLCAG
jgi:oligoendopeptidase F